MLRRHVRESDYVIRRGGDEFLLLLTCTANEAQRKVGDLKTAFEQERRIASLPDGICLSIGIASASHDVPSLEDAVRAADANMYRDKLGERQA